ncbi:MAG TPA: proton-conducting transporter membrane subunit [Geminicoccaceae bacterium]|nr:proton-conducting transporter membrane subunit [Geminicoccaceae bacterium]
MTGGLLGQALLVATVATPAVMLLACLSARMRARMLDLLALAPLPALAAALLSWNAPPLVLDPARRIMFALDLPGALLLGGAALLWCAAGLYARRYMTGAGRARFAVWWLLTLIGSLGVFVAADMATFYLTFGLASLAAWGLVVHDGTARALWAGEVYLVLAVLGEICLLIAFALLAAAEPRESLAIADVLAYLPEAPWRGLTLALLLAGFGLKMGLVPLHVWLPLAHPAAPMPASAVLSGVIVKAGVIGVLRFLPEGAALPDWGAGLAALGLLTAWWGVACGVTQRNPKTVLAYSTVSQMGLVGAVLGMGLSAGGGAVLPAAFYVAHHVLAKGALFLAVGVVAATGARRLRPVLLPAAILALGFGGLPLSGGYLAKLAVKETLGEGAVGLLATLAGAGSTLLMLHFLLRLRASAADGGATAPAGLVLPWLAMALGALVLPWALYAAAGVGSLAEALAPKALWAALWPVLLGAVAAWLLRRADPLPELPEGDVVVLVGRIARAGPGLAAPFERLDHVLQRWCFAGIALLAIMLVLGAALAAQNR